MSALKRPGIWDKKSIPIQSEVEISSVTETVSNQPNNNQQKEITAKRLEVKPQSVQASKRLDAKKEILQNVQTSKILKVLPLDAQSFSLPEVIPQNVQESKRLVDETLNHLGDKALELRDDETPKRKKAKSQSLVKKTYYIDHDIDGAIELMAVLQKGDQSDIVRKLLRSAIPEYYLTQWKVMRDHSK